jgi:hypothetical protein
MLKKVTSPFVRGAARAVLCFLDNQGRGLAREVLAEPVSPLTPVVLDRTAKLPDGTARVRLVLVDASGKEAGEIAKTDAAR